LKPGSVIGRGVVASYKYDPFGRIESQSGSLANDNVYRFSSKEALFKTTAAGGPSRDRNAVGPPPGSPPGADVFYGPEDSGVTCTRVPNSIGKEDAAINCCRDPNKSNNGIWFPGLNDCHNPLDDCLNEAGIAPEDIPPHPRFGSNNGIR